MKLGLFLVCLVEWLIVVLGLGTLNGDLPPLPLYFHLSNAFKLCPLCFDHACVQLLLAYVVDFETVETPLFVDGGFYFTIFMIILLLLIIIQMPFYYYASCVKAFRC